MTDSTYEERYCAFVDILGFGSLISTLECEKIQTLLRHIHRPFPGTPENQENTGYRAQSISDAVAVSMANSLITLLSASGTDRGSGTATHSGQGRHGRAAVGQIVLPEFGR